MTMKMCRNILGVLGALLLTVLMGCVEEFDAEFSDMPTEGLVVEGNIISDSTIVFQLSKTLPLDKIKDNVDLFNTFTDVNAELSVKGSDGISWRGYGLGKGKYQVKVGVLQPDVDYYLEISYQGETYQSEPQKPLPMRKIEKLEFKQPDLEGPVSILLDTEEGDKGQEDYYLWFFEEDWEVRTHFATTALYDPWLNTVVHYPYPPVAQGWCYYGTDRILLGETESNTTNKIVGRTIKTIKNTDPRLSFLYSIRVQQRNLSRQEYEYYQVRSKLNNEMGGLFTPQPSELPTNITCSNPSRKVIGYVGCNMGIAYHQLYISEKDVFYVDNYICDAGKDPAGSYLDKFAAGFQVCDVLFDNSLEWAKIGCVDVRHYNADPQGRPSWWPNPYKYYKEEQDANDK